MNKRISAGVALFSENLLTGDLIKSLSIKDRQDRLSLIKLLGSDIQRVDAGLALTIISSAIENPEEEMSCSLIEKLNGISKKEAFRLYALLPRFALPVGFFPDCEEERQVFRDMAHINLSTALWLLDWNSKGRHSALISRLSVGDADKRAFVSEKLYSLCAYMKIHSKNKYFQEFSVPALWLMLEISKCLNDIERKVEGVSKGKRYKGRQRTVSTIEEIVAGNSEQALPTRPADSTKDLLENFYRHFMYEATALAKEQPGFDKVLFSDYLNAVKTWGRLARDAKGMIGYL